MASYIIFQTDILLIFFTDPFSETNASGWGRRINNSQTQFAVCVTFSLFLSFKYHNIEFLLCGISLAILVLMGFTGEAACL